MTWIQYLQKESRKESAAVVLIFLTFSRSFSDNHLPHGHVLLQVLNELEQCRVRLMPTGMQPEDADRHARPLLLARFSDYIGSASPTDVDATDIPVEPVKVELQGFKLGGIVRGADGQHPQRILLVEQQFAANREHADASSHVDDQIARFQRRQLLGHEAAAAQERVFCL
jgi:hypothetical protein